MNIAKATSKHAAEFQAIILAGPGSKPSLAPLTRNYVRGHGIEEPVPKALLPVGNKAMLHYPLAWLDAAGVTEVLIACQASHRPLLSHYVYSSAEFPALHITIQSVDDDESLGTADVLRELTSSIQTDFVILPCDFIPPPGLALGTLLNSYRSDVDRPTVTTLLYERTSGAKDGPPSRLMGLDRMSKTLIHVPVEEAGDDVVLRMSMLRQSPAIRFTTRYLDSHVYVLRRSVLDLLELRTDISSIKDELIPWLCRTQYREAARRKYGPTLNPSEDAQLLALEYSTVQANPVKRVDEGADSVPPLSPPMQSMSVTSSLPASPRPWPRSASGLDAGGHSGLRCAYVLHESHRGVASRANTLKTYYDANRSCLREGSFVPQQPTSSQQSSETFIDTKAQISSDSLVGPSTRVAERTSIKKSIIGSHCSIGKNVKISGCILMEHVVVKDGVKLENSIISRHTVVEDRCSVKESETATGVVLASGAEYKNEKIEQFESEDGESE